MRTLTSTPRADGFHMPAEFEEHDRCWMIWPQRRDTFRFGAKLAQRQFLNIARSIAKFEPVTIGVNDDQYDVALLAAGDFAQIVELSNDDFWMRDTGPTFVTNGSEIRGVDWCFNCWGGLVDGMGFPWDKDDHVAVKVCSMLDVDRYRLDDFVLEGGSIQVDGEGTLVTTESVLLSEGRNPQLSKEEIEQTLKDYLGVEKVIWLPEGIYGDDTNGHVDNIFNFSAPGEGILAWTDDEDDPQYAISKACLDILENETDARGRKIKVRKLHIPDPLLLTQEEADGMDRTDDWWPHPVGTRLTASYVNYYTANGGIIYPTFGDEKYDDLAGEVLEEAYPGYEVIGCPSREILLGGGNIHCSTQQQPAVRS